MQITIPYYTIDTNLHEIVFNVTSSASGHRLVPFPLRRPIPNQTLNICITQGAVTKMSLAKEADYNSHACMVFLMKRAGVYVHINIIKKSNLNKDENYT